MARRNFGHLHSQKFAAFMFAVAVLCATAFFLHDAAFSTLTMGVGGLYTAFVGARAWSDGQALKFGAPAQDVSPAKVDPKKAPAKEKDREVD